MFGLMRRVVSHRGDDIREEFNGESGDENVFSLADILEPAVIDFIEPLFKDNPRLVSQGGLFTRAPNGMHVKEWVERNFNGGTGEVWWWELVLPDASREEALKSLNRMNINHQSLFPDLDGAAHFVNFHLDLKGY